MTEQEKAALLTLMGVTHAQAKQTDQAIVSRSNFLKPISEEMQTAFAQVLHAPVQNQQLPPTVAEPVRPAQIQYSIPEPVLVPIVEPLTAPVKVDSDIINILKDINLNISRIASILEQKNDRQPKIKSTKST